MLKSHIFKLILFALSFTLMSQNSTAITNGQIISDSNQFSWLVKVDLCGGVIISERFILTAAHCVYDKPINLITLKGNGPGLIKNLPSLGKAKRVIIHENYSPWKESSVKKNDIALIELKEKLTFSDSLTQAKLANNNLPIDTINKKSNLTLGGYGRLANGKYAKRLHYINGLKLIPDSINSFWDNNINLQFLVSDDIEQNFTNTYFTHQYLGVWVNDSKSACRGDSGTPLVDVSSNTVYGLVSHGQDDCLNQPVFFLTKISHYFAWIQKKMRLDEN